MQAKCNNVATWDAMMVEGRNGITGNGYEGLLCPFIIKF